MGYGVFGGQIFIGYRQGVKRSYTKLMLQVIKKIFSVKSYGKDKKSSGKKGKNMWAEKQLKEMGKLGGKLILM